MREILLSTSLVLVLALSGCDDNDTKNDLTTSSIDGFVKQYVDLNVTEGETSIASLSTTGVSFEITGGGDASFFTLDGSELAFKTAQDYLEGGDNSYDVEISATDDNDTRRGRLLLITTNVVRQIIINASDTTAPVFQTGTALSMQTESTRAIVATDATEPITYALTGGAGFSLNGALLQAPAVATPEGMPTSVTITATDSATPSNTSTHTMAVTVTVPSATGVVFSAVTDSRVTWADANATCAAMAPVGTWELPTYVTLNTNNIAVFELVKNIDSDDNASTMPSAFKSVLWSSTPDANLSQTLGLWYKDGTADSAEELPIIPTSEYYFTCVKK